MNSSEQQPINKEHTCPICLQIWTDPTVLDNCKHIFCFGCIIEWTRLKPECPLCKTTLQKLKHQFWHNDNQVPGWDSEGGQIEDIMELRSEYEMNQIMQKSIRSPDIEKHAIVQVVKSMLGELHSLRSLSITTYANEAIYKRAIAEIEQEMSEYRHLLLLISRNVQRAELFNEHAFRRIVYKKNLMPNSICPPMFNLTFNTEYIRNNEESVKKHILPFVVREVTALTGNNIIDINTYLTKLLDYFTARIKRQEIVNFLSKGGIENPHQFLNNLLHFASSGQTLKVYDQNSEYTPRRSNHVGNLIPDDDDVLILHSNSDVEVIGESRNRPRGTNPLPRDRERSTQSGASINNSLLFMNQNQPSSSTTSNNGIMSPSQAAIRQMYENISNMSQRMSHQLANYFYVPPMAGTHQQNLRLEDTNQDRTMSDNNRRRRREDDHETAPMVLDDSDDAIQIVDEVKKRKTGEKEDNVESNDDDDEDGLLLVDQVNGSF